MKKHLSLLLSCFLLLGLIGCSDISQEDYDAVCVERDSLLQENRDLKAKLEKMTSDQEKVSVKISGSFTAIVWDIIPDYSLDPNTPMLAIVTGFQGSPYIIDVREIEDSLEIGTMYEFEVVPTEYSITRAQYEEVQFYPDTTPYRIRVSSAHLADINDSWGVETQPLELQLID